MSDNIDLDISQFSHLIEQLYAAALNDTWSSFLDEIQRLTQSNKAFIFLNSVKEATPLVMEYRTHVSHASNIMKEYQVRFKEDPFYEVARYAPEGSVIDFSQHIDLRDHEDSAFYKDILEPVDSFRVIASVLFRDGLHESYLSLCRGIDDPPFSSQDLALLKLLTPHLRQAGILYKHLRINAAKTDLSTKVLDNSSTALVVCNAHAEVIYINSLASELCNTNSQVSLVAGQLRFTERKENEKLLEAIRFACELFDTHLNAHKSLIIKSAWSQKAVMVTVSPLLANTGMNELNFPACLISFTLEKEVRWDAVRDYYKLTERETQIVQELYKNKKLASLSEDFNVSYNTLKTHMKAIFAKFDVGSQTELMILLNEYTAAN